MLMYLFHSQLRNANSSFLFEIPRKQDTSTAKVDAGWGRWKYGYIHSYREQSQ